MVLRYHIIEICLAFQGQSGGCGQSYVNFDLLYKPVSPIKLMIFFGFGIGDLVNKEMFYRFKSELKTLRKKYSTETEKAKNQFMNIHSKQVEIECLLKVKLCYFYDN